MSVEAGAAIKGGAMLASGGLLADVVLFTDHSYMYLAATGAVVSMFGVVHEVFGHDSDEYTVREAVAEMIKGLVLGFISIPFWFFVLTEGLLGRVAGIELGQVSNSLSLIISFALSWYTVPLFGWIVYKVKRSAK